MSVQKISKKVGRLSLSSTGNMLKRLLFRGVMASGFRLLSSRGNRSRLATDFREAYTPVCVAARCVHVAPAFLHQNLI